MTPTTKKKEPALQTKKGTFEGTDGPNLLMGGKTYFMASTGPTREKAKQHSKGDFVEVDIDGNSIVYDIRPSKPDEPKIKPGFKTAKQVLDAEGKKPAETNLCDTCARVCAGRGTGILSCKDYLTKEQAAVELQKKVDQSGFKGTKIDPKPPIIDGDTGKPLSPATQQEKTSPTLAASPALKTVEGQIVSLFPDSRVIVVKDRMGNAHPFKWMANLDYAMMRLKQWWFTRITAELRGSEYFVTVKEFFERPDDWPTSRKEGQGDGQYQPRNEKLIALQSTLKTAAEVYIHCTAPGTQDFDAAMNVIKDKAVEITNALMQESK
jgi:hypothetical protein